MNGVDEDYKFFPPTISGSGLEKDHPSNQLAEPTKTGKKKKSKKSDAFELQRASGGAKSELKIEKKMFSPKAQQRFESTI